MKFNPKSFLVLVVFGAILCIVLGLIFFGAKVFNPETPFFQFVSFGIVGSISFGLFRFKRYRDVIYINILLFALLYFIAGSRFFLTHLLYFLSVVFSVYLFSRFIFEKLTSLRYSRPLIMASIFSIMFIVVTVILAIIYHSEGMEFLPLKNMPIGFLIGLGLGIGFEIPICMGRNGKDGNLY